MLFTLCYLFAFPAGWKDNTLDCIAQTFALSTLAVECWVYLPRPQGMLDHSDPFVHPIKKTLLGFLRNIESGRDNPNSPGDVQS